MIDSQTTKYWSQPTNLAADRNNHINIRIQYNIDEIKWIIKSYDLFGKHNVRVPIRKQYISHTKQNIRPPINLLLTQSKQIEQLIDRIDTLENLISKRNINHGPPKIDISYPNTQTNTNSIEHLQELIEKVSKHFNFTSKATGVYTRYRHPDCNFNIIELFHKSSTNEEGEEFYKIKLRQGTDTLWTDINLTSKMIDLIPHMPVTSHEDPDQSSKRVWHIPAESTTNENSMKQLKKDLVEIITHLHPNLK